MKNRLCILLVSVLLCSCSAERQMAYLLRRHPELRTATDTVLVPVSVVLPQSAATIDIPWSVAVSDSMRAADMVCSDSTNARPPQTFSVQSGHAKATVTVTEKGLELTAEQLPDTIQAEGTATVPIVEVHDLPMEEKPISAFFRYLGIFVAILFGIGVVVVIVKIFV